MYTSPRLPCEISNLPDWRRIQVCVCVCVCVCMCVCVCVRMYSFFFGDTHTLFISGKWGIQKQWGYPQIQKSLVKQSRGSMHAIGCPLALLESSIFSPVTGRKSYLLCNFFLHIFGLLIAMFLGTSYEYTPWKWGIIHVPSFAAKYPIPRKPPHTCKCVCVCVCVHLCGLARATLWEYLNNRTQWWLSFHQLFGGKSGTK